MNPIDMTKFRKRIGLQGAENIFKISLMAAAAYNIRHWMNKNALSSFVSWLLALVGRLENVLFGTLAVVA